MALAAADTPDEPPPAGATGDTSRGADATPGVQATRTSDGLELAFSFAAPTPAALFRRADTVWMVFDSQTPIDIEPIRNKGGSIISRGCAFAAG